MQAREAIEESPEAARRDGRRVRAERTRWALVDALLALLEEGDPQPTAARIAERAGVSERSVFQHFPEREGLFEAATLRQGERIADMVSDIPPDAPLEERLEAYVEQRTAVLEMVSPVRRAALVVEGTSETVTVALQAVREAGWAQVRAAFATEVAAAPESERAELAAALSAATSWPTWENLRVHQGLDLEAASGVLRRMVRALVVEPGRS
jgi:TetR/AcrR family transcriptional regulator, regulator of autoinduction and epiphytic fitness